MLSFEQLSYWEKETFINHIDFLIIGSGIVGLSTAIYLKNKYPDKKALVIERGYLPTGASSKNAGFACIGSPSELIDDLIKNSDKEVFSTVNKRWKGLQNLKLLLGDEQIGFKQLGSYELFDNQDEFNKCVSQIEYLNTKLKPITGFTYTFNINNNIVLNSNFKGFKHAISHQAEGQIDTGLMISNLLKLAIEKGVKVLSGIEAKSITKQSLNTQYGAINFNKLFICTNGFAKQLLPKKDINPARAQVLITKPITDLKFKGIYHFNAGYYYFRNVGNRVLFGGGRQLDMKGETTTEFKQTELIKHDLETYLKDFILPDSNFEIDYYWSGIMGIGHTKHPIIKQIDEHIYCGVRLGGMGVAIGSLVGKELAEMV
jgi:glycine/D-amino acid oxidase-like deaminating enzyme